MNLAMQIAEELAVNASQVVASIELLDGGATVPFVARYRKEVTGGLNDTQLRQLQERLLYLRDLEARRSSVIESIRGQGKLTKTLEEKIRTADTKTRLEDLYAPYKPKRKTKAQLARQAGIAPLLDQLLENPHLHPVIEAKTYCKTDSGYASEESVLDGAKHIFMERASEDADLLEQLREFVWERGYLQATAIEENQAVGSKYADYFEFSERICKIPSHRALALFRGRAEGVLRLRLHIAEQDQPSEKDALGACEVMIGKRFGIKNRQRPGDPWLLECVRATWRAKLSLHLETELNLRLRKRAEADAIQVFGHNLRDLLLAAPAGAKVTMGLDPGLRTGVKVVVVDTTGKLLAHTTIFPHAPQKKWRESKQVLADLIAQYQVELVSIGNGTASRETDVLLKELAEAEPALKFNCVVVSEAGASVYSASERAAKEFPELDVSFRGAVSIARRLQDPLAELVKVEPKAIGVGQYQHDVNQIQLARQLDAVVEDCVNAVGVEVNTASVELLAYVAGLTNGMASSIVQHREANGLFRNRAQLLQVHRLGPKAYEQCAGFLRIHGGENALDASAVHPESYPVVNKILKASNKGIHELIGNRAFLRSVKVTDYVDDKVGVLTVEDILSELEKPGRDPRPEFKTVNFQKGIEKIQDLTPGMVLEGVVSNVTNFGAFVDIGVHQDGLVHISALSHDYVKDPRQVVKAGDVVKVKVMQIDVERKRIGLSLRMDDEPIASAPSVGAKNGNRKPKQASSPVKNNAIGSDRKKYKSGNAATPLRNRAMAEAFAKLKQK